MHWKLTPFLFSSKSAFIVLSRLAICLLFATFFLFSYLEKHNNLIKIRFLIPKEQKEIKEIKEENMRLKFEINQFENPKRLFELSRRHEFSYLKHTFVNEILLCAQTNKEGDVKEEVEKEFIPSTRLATVVAP